MPLRNPTRTVEAVAASELDEMLDRLTAMLIRDNIGQGFLTASEHNKLFRATEDIRGVQRDLSIRS